MLKCAEISIEFAAFGVALYKKLLLHNIKNDSCFFVTSKFSKQMRSLKKICAALLLLNVSTHSKGAVWQQPQDSYVKGPSSNKSSSLLEKDSSGTGNITPPVRDTSYNQINTKLKLAAGRLKQKTEQVPEFVKQNGFNDEYCFLIDMSLPSGKKRFFVYNIKKDSIEASSLVSHGSGSYTPDCNDQLLFSNMPNSNATSLGKYKIGTSYNGTYGLSYKLYGLEPSNSKAFERAIVLHSDSYVPEAETYPKHIYQSAGCPIVAPNFLSTLGKYIKSSDKPVLLWIYN